MTNKQLHGTPFSASSYGAVSATATVSGLANQIIFVTDISGSSDAARATVAISNGTAILWIDAMGTAAYHHQFQQPIPCTGTLTILSTGTSFCSVNVAGFYITSASGN